MSKARTLSIVGVFTAVAVGGAAWMMSGTSNRPAPSTGPAAPHMDNDKRIGAIDETVIAFDQMRTRLSVFADVARKTNSIDAYNDMLRKVDRVFDSTRITGTKEGTIAGAASNLRANFLRDIDTAARTFFTLSRGKNPAAFDNAMIDPNDATKPSDAGKLYREWPTYTAKIQLALGEAPSDLAKNEQITKNNPLTNAMVAILPTTQADGTVKHSVPFQMMYAIADELKKSGANYLMSGMNGLSEILAKPAPVNPSGGSDLYHALDRAEKWLAIDADMRRQTARYDLAAANVQANYTVNVKTTLGRVRTDLQESCVKIGAALKANHGFKGEARCKFD